MELLWIFPRKSRNAASDLAKSERYIQKELAMIQTTTRRAKTEWYRNEKVEIVDAFLTAFQTFKHIGGQIENPQKAFTINDITRGEIRKNASERERMQAAATAQLKRMKAEQPQDYDYLCSCANWKIDESYRSCPKIRSKN